MSPPFITPLQIPYLSEWFKILIAGIEGDREKALSYSALLMEQV